MSLEKTIKKYKERTTFDKYVRVSHPNDCYPGNCSLTGYVRDGKIVYQEQTGKYPVVDPNTPDWNPAGCARQCSYALATHGKERIKQPMKQLGRGSGKWVPISWDEAYEIIADKLIDAMEYNPQSILYEIPPGEGGPMYSQDTIVQFMTAIGGICFDLESASIQDLSAGLYETFGKYQFASTWDDFFYSDLILIWNINPAYSRQEKYHFLTEARYRGAELVVIAPDYSPSAVHADYYIPVKAATDAALALGMCRVIIEENLVDWDFVKEQTDLPLLVRMDNRKFLRESDFGDGSGEVFYIWDSKKGLTKAPRDTLDLGDLDPVLEGSFEVEIDGKKVEVKPVFQLLKEKLEREYDLERVREITGVHPDVVRMLARKVASGRTSILLSWNTAKMFHGDLIERAMCLLLGLTGNWGKNGTGIRSWCVVYEFDALAGIVTSDPLIRESVQGRWRRKYGRELTEEELEGFSQGIQFRLISQDIPSVFFWYFHGGYGEIWDKIDLKDAGIPRKIGDYIKEGLEKGWYEYIALPEKDVEPKVLFIVASNPLRNKPMTQHTYLKKLWPKLDLIVCIDYRWSEAALYSDIVLPATFHHEKMQFHSLPNPETRFWSFAGKAVEPVDGAKDEITIAIELAMKIAERARARGLKKYRVPHGVTLEKVNKLLALHEIGLELTELPEEIEWLMGVERDYESIPARVLDIMKRLKEKLDVMGLLLGGTEVEKGVKKVEDEDVRNMLRDLVRVCKEYGVIAEDVTLEEIEEKGFVKYEGLGKSVYGLNNAAHVEPDKTVVAFSMHVKDKLPFPTLTGRAQFYIDHDWFLEAGEELPCHKNPPAVLGGDRSKYPFILTSGHNRYSTHCITFVNELQMNMHRGEPFVYISKKAAEKKGVKDGDYIRVFNDFGEVIVQAKVSSLPADDQIIFYHGWETFLFPNARNLKSELSAGLIKPLHLAAGNDIAYNYGHFYYRFVNWQPQMIYRHTCVDFEPLKPEELEKYGLKGS